MYGVAVKRYAIGSTVLSNRLVRAANAPNLFPAHQLNRIDGRRRKMSKGTALLMMSITGVGKR